jgi:hypothetical protein
MGGAREREVLLAVSPATGNVVSTT